MNDVEPTLDEATAVRAALLAHCQSLELPDLPHLKELRLSIERLVSVITEREDGP